MTTNDLSLEGLAQEQQNQANYLDDLAASLRSLALRQQQQDLYARLQSAEPMRLGSYPSGADVAAPGTTEPGQTSLLGAGVVTADSISAGAITVGDFADGAGSNFAPNPSFEVLNGAATNTDGVAIFAWGAAQADTRYSTATAKYGAQALRISHLTTTAQKELVSPFIPVQPGRRIMFRAWGCGAAGNNAAASLAVVLGQYKEDGTLIGGFLSGGVQVVGASTTFTLYSIAAAGTVLDPLCTKIKLKLSHEAGGAVGDHIFFDGVELFYLDDDVVHGSGNVVIDSTGILIKNGALTLQDEFGVTVATASGFAGGWADFLESGLYNASFGSGATGALPMGRSSSLPFWTLAKIVGNPTATRTADATFPSGFRVRTTFAALNDQMEYLSDRVAINGGWDYGIGGVYAASQAVGTSVQIDYQIRYYDASDVFISGNTQAISISNGVTPPTTYQSSLSNPAPMNARYARVRARVYEAIGHNAANYADLGYLSIREAPAVLSRTGFYWVDGMNVGFSAGQGDLQVGDPAGTTLNVDFTGAIGIYRGNTMDTYTPTVANGGVVTWAERTGIYIQIGKLVFVSIALTVSVAGSGATPLTITLPVAADLTQVSRQVLSGFSEAITAARLGPTFGVIDPTTGKIERLRGRDGVNITGADLLATGRIVLTGFYKAA